MFGVLGIPKGMELRKQRLAQQQEQPVNGLLAARQVAQSIFGDGVPMPPPPRPTNILDAAEQIDTSIKNISVENTLKHEGGFQNNKKDSGNYVGGKLIGTNFGITPESWADYIGKPPSSITVNDMKNITKDDAVKFYGDTWDRYKIGSKIPTRLQSQFFDIVVNNGYTGAMKVLQNASDVKEDGKFGDITRKAIQNLSNDSLAQAREDMLSKEYKKQFPGYKKRVNSFKNGQ